MTDTIEFRSDVSVELVRHMASDEDVIHAAKVSTLGSRAENATPDLGRDMGFIEFLMTNRHGSPFEHSVFTFLIEAPIFVWREFMRHRIASYNEESGRYKQLAPVFYIPAQDRALAQVGRPGHYDLVAGTDDQFRVMEAVHEDTARIAYQNYQQLLDLGVAKEVARMTLPVNIFSSAYVTINARSLMNFLSLRTKREYSTFPSFPQREIEMVAEKMEESFQGLMPLTYTAFDQAGRVAP